MKRNTAEAMGLAAMITGGAGLIVAAMLIILIIAAHC